MTALSAAHSRAIMWRRVMDDLSFEEARFSRGRSGVALSGSVMIAERGAPLRVDYRIVCDEAWNTRTVEVEQAWQGVKHILRMAHDGSGRWRRNGRDAPDLAGCTDVDLGVTPSTNALPINRLRLPIGGRGEIVAAWVRFPEFAAIPAPQSYERLAERQYRYTSADGSFTSIIEVDGDGLPIDYAGIWRRVAEGPAEPEQDEARGVD